MHELALFDLDDTLVDRRGAFLRWSEEFVAARGLGDAAHTFLVVADAHHSGPMDGFFAHVVDALDLAEPPELLWEQYRRRMPELATCRAQDLEALRVLRRAGWRIGIVTNGTADNQSAKIRNTGLGGLVDGWAISGEAGVRKPDPEIFRIAAARCGGTAGDGGWMIGDNLAHDVAGGQAAGLRTAWLQLSSKFGAFGDIRPDVVVSTVTEAVEAVLTASG